VRALCILLTAEAVKRVFALDDVPALEPRYNVAPTQDVPTVRAGEEGARAFALLHWGLVPKWAKEKAIGNRMINARAESLARSPRSATPSESAAASCSPTAGTSGRSRRAGSSHGSSG
jgi:putative SOS response-associated peptidase YedK